MTTILLAIGLVCVVEGLIWALAPAFLKRMAERLPDIDEQSLRIAGVAVLALGTGLVFLAKHLH